MSQLVVAHNGLGFTAEVLHREETNEVERRLRLTICGLIRPQFGHTTVAATPTQRRTYKKCEACENLKTKGTKNP